MVLYIKQKVFSITDRYQIYDENENPYFQVESELFTMTAKLHLLDMEGKELFYIYRKLNFLLGQYEIYSGEYLCATISQKFKIFSPKLEVASQYGDFEINGDILSRNYSISHNGVEVGRVSKKWFSVSDAYALEIFDSHQAAFFCALVIAIDNCLHNENHS